MVPTCLPDGRRPRVRGIWRDVGRRRSFLDFVVTPDNPTVPVRLFVRNPPVDNQITIDAGAGASRLRSSPVRSGVRHPGAGQPLSVPVRVAPARGARPVEFERGSADTRFLGCWIETR